MRPLDGEQMLTAWDDCRERPADEAAISLLSLACLQPVEELAALPLAERNALLLQLHSVTLGRGIEGFAICSECGAQLEFGLDAQHLARALHASPAETVGAGLTMRPANTRDLLVSLSAADEQQARSILLARTLGLSAEDSDAGLMTLQNACLALGTEVLLERFEQLNASAEILVQLQCAACRRSPLIDLDIARFVVREIMAAARRLMVEIHELASAYAWSERSIASMSSARRSAYLEMLRT